MEVYATIFLIFVSHVLSSFTRTITSRYRDRKHIPQEKFRKIPIFYFQHQNNDVSDDENQPDTAVEYIVPLLEEYREKIPEKKLSHNISPNVVDKLIKPRIPSARFHLNNYLDKENKNPSIEFRPIQLAETAPFAQEKTNLKPWKKLCSNYKCSSYKPRTVCNKEWSATPCYASKKKCYPSKKQSCGFCTTGFFPHWKTTPNQGGPWLFFTEPKICNVKAKRIGDTSGIVKTYEIPMSKKYYRRNGFTVTVNDKRISEENQSNTDTLYYTPSASVVSQKEINSTRFMKKRTFDTLKKKLNVEESIKENKFIQNGVVSKIEKINKLGERIRKKRSAAHVEFFPLGYFDKRNNVSKSIPSCQKSCFYNLTALVNARTIKPPAYYKKKGPSLVLCCQGKDDATSTNKNSKLNEKELNNSENQTVTASNITEAVSVNAVTAKSYVTPSSLYKIYMQFRNVTARNDKYSSAAPKEKFVLKLLTKDMDDLIDLHELESEAGFHDLPLFLLKANKENKEKTMKAYVMKVRHRKQPRPWDKFCRCEGSSTCCTDTISSNKHPWISTCCLESVTSREFVKGDITSSDEITHTLARVSSRKQLVSAEKTREYKEDRKSEGVKTSFQAVNEFSIEGAPHKSSSKPDIKYMTAKKQELLNILQGRADNKNNLLVLVRIPVSVAKKYKNNGGINLVLPVNNTLFSKYIKTRSIFDKLIPSILRKTTLTPRDHIMKPWEEPCKLKKQEKFILFSTHLPSFCAKEVNRKNKFCSGRTTETGFLGLNVKEIPDTCPSCGRRTYNLFSKFQSPNMPKYKIPGEPYQTYEGIDVIDPSNNNEMGKEECDENCITYLLDLPNKGAVESSSPMIPEGSLNTNQAWRIIQNNDNPLKYYIEVPETFSEMIKKSAVIDDTQGLSYIPENVLNEIFSRNRTKAEKFLLKPTSHKSSVVLYLQPYEFNGHKVYLPITELEQSRRGQMVQSPLEQNQNFDDYMETPDNLSKPRSQAADNLTYKNDSVIPFALIPAYLTFHPHNKFAYEFNIQPKSNKISQLDSDTYQPERTEMQNSPYKHKDRESRLISEPISIEKKWSKLAQQIENTLQNPLPIVKLSSNRNHVSSRKPGSKGAHSEKANTPYLDKPTYIILIKEVGDLSPISESDLTFVENHTLSNQADDFTTIKSDLAAISDMDKSRVFN